MHETFRVYLSSHLLHIILKEGKIYVKKQTISNCSNLFNFGSLFILYSTSELHLKNWKCINTTKHIRMRFWITKLHTTTIHYISHNRIPPPPQTPYPTHPSIPSIEYLKSTFSSGISWGCLTSGKTAVLQFTKKKKKVLRNMSS